MNAGAPRNRPDVWRWLASAVTMQCPAAGSVEICCLAGRYSPLALALPANRYLPRQDLPLWFSSGAISFYSVTNWHATLTDRDIDTAARQIRFIIIGRTKRRDPGTAA